MINPVTSGTNVHTPAALPPANKAANTNSEPTRGVQDKVELSSTAQAHLTGLKAAVQEASETPAQTAKEAQGGDLQAKRLQAKEAQQSNILTKK